MAVQYSILSALIRPEIQEKISIGLLLFNNTEVYFSFSKNKLQVCKELLSPSSYKIFKDILENIENKIEADGLNLSNKNVFKIYKSSITDNIFSISYISYLSRYSNNTISFSDPKEIYLELKDEHFSVLFKKYIDDIIKSPDEPRKIKPVEYIKNMFGERLKEHYDLNKEVTHLHVKNLITPVRIDFAGKNEIDVYAQTIDMESGPGTVASQINAFIQLKTIYEKNKVPMKDFVISQEPSKEAFPKQHDMWMQLKSSGVVNYVDLSESEDIVIYAEQHGVVPLSKSNH